MRTFLEKIKGPKEKMLLSQLSVELELCASETGDARGSFFRLKKFMDPRFPSLSVGAVS